MILHREYIVKNCKNIVVKVGTRLLTDSGRIPILISQIAALRERGYRIILVSSGAVGIGMKLMGLSKRPVKLAEVQALASLGQAKLISMYNDECRKYGFLASQLLLTADDLRDRERHVNFLNCIHSLLANNILPIVNENDAVSVAELKFGDNDILAGLMASMTLSELTVILTTETGLREKIDGKLGQRISVVEKITGTLKNSAQGTDDNNLSIGGMISKLRAAEIVNAAGDYLWVADGRIDDILIQIADAKDVGTLFLPKHPGHLQARKRWIKFFSKRKGRLVIDDGAIQAIAEKGKSLLPSGVVEIEGAFKRGDTLEVFSAHGKLIARGLSNYSVEECMRIAGRKSSEISSVLEYAGDPELIHRDNMVLITH
jgi:glutamate 5-kinase